MNKLNKTMQKKVIMIAFKGTTKTEVIPSVMTHYK